MSVFKKSVAINSRSTRGRFTYFLDRRTVTSRVNRMELKAMNHIGGYMRKTMRNMMRASNSATVHSQPGEAPRTGDLAQIKKLTDYSYEPRKHSLVVGPAIFRYTPTVRPVNKRTIPQLLNEGGLAVATAKQTVILDTQKSRIYAYGSKGAAKIRRQKKFKKDQKRSKKTGSRNSDRRYKILTLAPGIRRFKPRPFVALTVIRTLRSGQFYRHWKI